MDLLGDHVLRRDIPDGTIQADVVVMLDVGLHQTPRIVQRQWRSRPDALAFERFVPTLDFSVRLRIVGEVLTWVMPEIRMNSLKPLVGGMVRPCFLLEASSPV